MPQSPNPSPSGEQQPSVQIRLIICMVLAVGILFLHSFLSARFFPQEQPPEPAPLAADGAKPPAADPLLEEGDTPAEADAEAVAEDVDASEPAEAGPAVPEAYLTLGSLDPASGYRMLVTLTNRGAAVARIELNDERYRETENMSPYLRDQETGLSTMSGYLGQLQVAPRLGAEGFTVEVVGPGTPAAEAGLKAGDRIVALDGVKIESHHDLKAAVAETRAGQQVKLSVERAGKTLELTATLTRRPMELVQPERLAPRFFDDKTPLGYDPFSFLLTLQQLDKQEIKEFAKVYHEERELPGLNLREGTWEVESQSASAVTFVKKLTPSGIELRKTFRLAKATEEQRRDPDFPAYHLELELDIVNRGDAPHDVAYQLTGATGLPLEGYWYANKVGRGWSGVGIRDFVVKFRGGTTQLVSARTIAADKTDTPWADDAVLEYIGTDAQYFSVVLKPQRKEDRETWFARSLPLRVGPETSRAWMQMTDTSSRVISKPVTLAPGEKLTHQYTVFAGPKRPELLAQYELNDLVYYGWFGWIAVPLLHILHFFYFIVGNYGIAIILLTVLVRLCLFPISRKQALNAQKMQELQPEMKKLQEIKDLQKRHQAQMELWRKHGFNPYAGCLPMFLQLPIFIALYRSLMVDVELRQAPLITDWIRWASNLAAPDMLFDWSGFMPRFIADGTGFLGLGPYFNLLPIVTIALFIVQQKMMMPPPTDEQQALQQKMMKYMMIFFGLMFFKVASGLCVYFIASSLWGLAERKLLPKYAAKHAHEAKPETPGWTNRLMVKIGKLTESQPSREKGNGAPSGRTKKKWPGKKR